MATSVVMEISKTLAEADVTMEISKTLTLKLLLQL